MEQLFPTPEDALRGDIPARYSRAVAVAEWGGFAYVVLGLNDPPHVEFEGGVCERVDGGWRPGGSGGGLGGGWSRIGETGVVSLFGTAPDGIASVHVRFRGDTIECPVQAGYFLFTAWGLSSEEAESLDFPVVAAHLVTGGDVVDPPQDPDRLLSVHRWFRERFDAFVANRDPTKGNGISMTPISPDDVPDVVHDRLRDLHGGGGSPEVEGPDDTSS